MKHNISLTIMACSETPRFIYTGDGGVLGSMWDVNGDRVEVDFASFDCVLPAFTCVSHSCLYDWSVLFFSFWAMGSLMCMLC